MEGVGVLGRNEDPGSVAFGEQDWEQNDSVVHITQLQKQPSVAHIRL